MEGKKESVYVQLKTQDLLSRLYEVKRKGLLKRKPKKRETINFWTNPKQYHTPASQEKYTGEDCSLAPPRPQKERE